MTQHLAHTIGIDPGLSGGLAVLDCEGALVGAWRLPLVERKSASGKVKRALDARALHEALAQWPGARVYLEAVSAAPGMGVTSAFSFGHGAGVLDAVLAIMGFDVTRVAPVVWKRALRVPTVKSEARAMAVKKWGPGVSPRASDDGMAEAALLAWYGHMIQRGPSHATA